MLKAAVRRKFDMIAAWSVDRLGHSLQDLASFLGETQGCRRRFVSAPAGTRHLDAIGPGSLPNVRGLCRIRGRDDTRPDTRRACPG
jgi:hypothetical protein